MKRSKPASRSRCVIKRAIVIGACLAICLFPAGFEAGAGDREPGIEAFLTYEIAVEKTGPAETSADGASMIKAVGSLRIDLTDKRVYVTEFFGHNNQMSTLINTFRMTGLEMEKSRITFDCVDISPATYGLEWKGEAGLTADNAVDFNMTLETGRFQWRNLTKQGKEWLKKHPFARVNLGIAY